MNIAVQGNPAQQVIIGTNHGSINYTSSNPSDSGNDIIDNVVINSPGLQQYLHRFYQRTCKEIDRRRPATLQAQNVPHAVQMIDVAYMNVSPVTPAQINDLHSEPHHNIIFASFQQALEHHHNRVIFLGKSGSGKTTTLLQIARAAAAERILDARASVPVWGSIHRWDPTQTIPGWIQQQEPDIDLAGHSLLYLLDGLDELGTDRPQDTDKRENGEDDKGAGSSQNSNKTGSKQLDEPIRMRIDPRAQFIEAVNLQLRNAQVVINCRTGDYEQIGTKLALTGAVTLLPLQDEDIKQFLLGAGQSKLWHVFEQDPTLKQLAQTPLLLALLSDAVGLDSEIDFHSKKLTESSIFAIYIDERFKHEAKHKEPPSHNRTWFCEQEFAIRILEQIALQMWDDIHSPSTTATITQIADAIQTIHIAGCPAGLQRIWQILLKYRRSYRDNLRKDAHEFAQTMQTMNFLQEDADGNWTFIHLKLRDYFAARALIGTLKARNQWRRRKTAQAVGYIGDPQAIPGLIEALRDSDVLTRATAAWALVQIGQTAVPDLIATLKDADIQVCMRAAEALGTIGDAKAVPHLIEALKEADTELRRTAAWALTKIEVSPS